MNNRAYEIRLEINRLKKELLEIEGDQLSKEESANLCASATCAHDVVIENLQKLCKDYDIENLAVMACWDNGQFYSTNVSPKALPYYLRDVTNIAKFLEPVLSGNSLATMQQLLENGTVTELKKTDLLEEHNFIAKTTDDGWKLTLKGWQTFIVLGHLTFVVDIKVPPEKAIPISKAFQEVLGKLWGERLGMSAEEAIERLKESGWMEKLEADNVTLKDIEDAVYENAIGK